MARKNLTQITPIKQSGLSIHSNGSMRPMKKNLRGIFLLGSKVRPASAIIKAICLKGQKRMKTSMGTPRKRDIHHSCTRESCAIFWSRYPILRKNYSRAGGGDFTFCWSAHRFCLPTACYFSFTSLISLNLRKESKMNLVIVIGTGLAFGALLGASIFFEKREPYKVEILIASTIRSILVALLTGFSLSSHSSWYAGAGSGLIYGFLFGLVIFLAKGGFKSKDAPYVVLGASISGGLAGLVIVNYGF
jgi:hypothetical protein